ncbi:tumor necrosis factor receptor superfamily member 14-like isoform 2-T2 [Clarias gariepinus]|uniref:tumor necrosis factor receptor superfamily member 14-like isoform X2 n=1 Tax=Clarias gariepinus TaxID=13013 RepID=UPI00234DBFC9|nr:tumor necrosis factor receptor superfamily member 14-like isoform X2 [Clarias gariepinus]
MKITLGDMKCGEETFLYFFLHYKGKTVPPSTLKMAYRLKYSFIVATTFLLNIDLCYCACARAEYEINGECCPMCAPGTRVYRHCTEYISTTCVPCVDATFTSEPNGLPNCFICAVCDPGQGLKVKTACTQTLNTVCEPLEGFYCTNNEKESCTQAVEHTKCSPGQYIKQKGTADKDAECAGCKNGTYSEGSQEICKQHTKCEDLGLTEIKPGTTMSDVECGSKIQVALIAGIIISIVVVAVALVILFIRHKIGRHAVRNPETETGVDTREPGSARPFLRPSKWLNNAQPFWT